MISFEVLKYYLFYFLAFMHFQVYQIYNKFFDHEPDAIGMSLDFSSNTGQIYRAKCLFEGNNNYIEPSQFIVENTHSIMSFGESGFVSPIPSWAKCVWKSGVESEWNEDESESRGIKHTVDLDLLGLVPPSVFAEIRANNSAKKIKTNDSAIINKNLQLGLDFDGPTLYPRWEIDVWEYDPKQYERKKRS